MIFYENDLLLMCSAGPSLVTWYSAQEIMQEIACMGQGNGLRLLYQTATVVDLTEHIISGDNLYDQHVHFNILS